MRHVLADGVGLPGVDREHEGVPKEFHFSGFARIVLVVLLAEAVGLLNGARFAVLADRHPDRVPDIK